MVSRLRAQLSASVSAGGLPVHENGRRFSADRRLERVYRSLG